MSEAALKTERMANTIAQALQDFPLDLAVCATATVLKSVVEQEQPEDRAVSVGLLRRIADELEAMDAPRH